MNTEDLIQEFVAKRTIELSEQKNSREKALVYGQALFYSNLQTWLGEMLAEFDFLGQPEPLWKGNVLSFSRLMSWRGIQGKFWAGGAGHFSSGIDFKFDSHSYEFKLEPHKEVDGWTKGCGYTILATGPVDGLKLGEFLYEVQQMHAVFMEKKKAAEEQQYQNALFWKANQLEKYRDEKDLQDYLEELIKQFPNEAEIFKQKADRRLEKLADERVEKEQEEEKRRLLQAEEERLLLEWKAAFKPITIYLVKFGARMEGALEGETVLTDEVYCLEPEPLAGWWFQFKYHELVKVRLPNVIKVEEVVIDDPDKLPSNVCVCKTITSPSYPDQVQLHLREVPAELYAIIQMDR